MTRRLVVSLALAASLLASLFAAAPALAAAPEWKLTVTPNADYFLSGSSQYFGVYKVEAENVGAGPTLNSAPIDLKDVVPAGLTVESSEFYSSAMQGQFGIDDNLGAKGLCSSMVECEYPGPPAATGTGNLEAGSKFITNFQHISGESVAFERPEWEVSGPGIPTGTVIAKPSGGGEIELSKPAGASISGAALTAFRPPLKHGKRLIMLVRVGVPAAVEGPLQDIAEASGGNAPSVQASATNAASPEPPFGLLHFDAALSDSSFQPYTLAGGRPYQFTTEFNFATYSGAEATGYRSAGTNPLGDPKHVTADLPPGLVVNPQAVPACSLADYFTQECSRAKDSVGSAAIRFGGLTEGAARFIVPVFNLQPQGAYPGELGIYIYNAPFSVITSGVQSGSDYGITATNLTAEVLLTRIRLNLWGVPAETSHNGLRGKECQLVSFRGAGNFSSIAEIEKYCEEETGTFASGGPAGVPPTPFITMPTECSGQPLSILGRYDTWQGPGIYAEDSTTVPAVDSCSQLSFAPSIEARPTTNLADAPSGLEFNLHVPQNEESTGRATSSMKEAVVTLPSGLTVNPSSANGLAGCSPSQVGLATPVGEQPAHFSEEPAQCPDASKIGSVVVHTRLLHNPLRGSVYLATQHQNPFGSLLAAYIVLEGEGLIFKLPGRIQTDPSTGRITAKFLENPQLPFEDFNLNFFGGARGDLRTPAVCGTYETTSALTPYSHMEGEEEATPIAEPTSEFETTEGPQGGSCSRKASSLPNAPVFRAGTESAQAGAFTPFGFRLARADGSQEIEKIETLLPPGLTGKLAGVAECSDAQLAVAQSREHEGGGAEEKASPACPASSEVGTVQVASGAGPTPLYVTGKAYLAGRYKGAPLSLAIITPAIAGPFDLGDVVVRTALYVDPETARIKAVSDPIPHILQGIPLDVRQVTLKMSRPNFTLNPTNCGEMGFSGAETSLLGSVAPLTQRFQVGGCQSLPFKPKLSISLKGATHRSGTPALKAVLRMPPGSANVASAQVTLPHSEFLDQGHLENICTRVQFAEHACPASSVYGHAVAYTPLLDHPLEGPVYLRSSTHLLPDLAVDLEGQINVVLDSKVDSVHESLRNTFEVVPDAPVSKFVLTMKGGKHSLIENSTDICLHRQRATGLFRGQNGKTVEVNPLLKANCKKKGKHKHGKKGHRHH